MKNKTHSKVLSGVSEFSHRQAYEYKVLGVDEGGTEAWGEESRSVYLPDPLVKELW